MGSAFSGAAIVSLWRFSIPCQLMRRARSNFKRGEHDFLDSQKSP
jgi:hypothetical protein